MIHGTLNAAAAAAEIDSGRDFFKEKLRENGIYTEISLGRRCRDGALNYHYQRRAFGVRIDTWTYFPAVTDCSFISEDIEIEA